VRSVSAWIRSRAVRSSAARSRPRCRGVRGNVVHVNDLADWVSREARVAGDSAGALATGARRPEEDLRLLPGDNVRYVVPHTISSDREHTVSFRVQQPIHGTTILRVGAVHRRKVRAVVPAEMVTLKLSPRLLADFHGSALRIDAVAASVEVPV
jgi:hypothetical protein